MKLVNWFVYDKGMDAWWADELNAMSDEMPSDLQTRLLAELESKISEGICIKKSASKHRHLRKLSRNFLLKWVAIICIPVLLVISLYIVTYPDGRELSPLIVTVERGERSSVVLPDGTRVKLNSDSELVYPGNFGRERRVKLRGEACFDVVYDKAHPFIVELGNMDVKVLGTTFNISSYEDQENITVVLLKGKVEVISEAKIYVMNPDDKIVYNKPTSTIHTSRVYSSDYIEWTKGSLFFENESLDVIVKVLSRTYNMEIRLASDTLKKERFTGTLGNGGILNALERLSLTSPIIYEMQDSVIILKKNIFK